MLLAGYEHAIPVTEQPQSLALEHSATGITNNATYFNLTKPLLPGFISSVD
jgi:hypothetical protein